VRSFVPAYELQRAGSLAEALAKLSRPAEGWIPFAGGTDLMVLYEAGVLSGRRFLSIWGIPELRGIRVAADHVEIGALATYTDVQRHPVLAQEFPALGAAGRETGGLAIQNRGTIGGNIANASPAADSPPALIAYDGTLLLASAGGRREVPLGGFFQGYKKMDLQPGDLITGVRLPRPGANAARRGHYYRKVGTRRAQAISKVVMAAVADCDGDRLSRVRIALGSVGPVTLVPRATEALLAGQRVTPALVDDAVRTLASEINPIDDIRSTADFRLVVAGNLLRQFLTSVAGSP
jgi:CO/xanthine dehydrogenase FAD-binding subunit